MGVDDHESKMTDDVDTSFGGRKASKYSASLCVCEIECMSVCVYTNDDVTITCRSEPGFSNYELCTTSGTLAPSGGICGT